MYQPSKSNLILKQIEGIYCPQALQKRFIFVPNVAIIYNRCYVKMILIEIGNFTHKNNNYCKAKKPCNKIIEENIKCTKCLGLKIRGKYKVLPIVY